MLAAPPFGASSNIALWRAYNKPPVELVVADLEIMLVNFVAYCVAEQEIRNNLQYKKVIQ